ncbi:DUF3108 domain-containing protein [Sungkyunkwania multivorans]|uniref:DUF3108 domain-containing protein n=1 Tax=Sungkyunkwania multivorans TaxID=1173618 RepID=A0ABW3CV88_9FLAO
MRRIFAIIALAAITKNGTAQQAFTSGEKLTYAASYNMSGLMTELAQLTMETKKVETSKSTLLHLKCKASTYSKWDTFFKIRDLYETYWSTKTFRPLLYKRNIDEGGYKKMVKYTYNHKTGVVKSHMKKKGYDEHKTHKISEETLDVVSTIYQIRQIPIASVSPGESKTFKVLFDREEHPIKVTYKGKEFIKAGSLGTKECYKLAVSAKGGSINGTIYLTADSNKIPTLIKFNIPVGSGQLNLKTASGLAN